MSIFKANDIRGIYGKDLQDRDAYTLGNVFSRYVKSKTIIVARDNRKSSPALHKALIEGITEAGANVTDIGIIDSPGAYFASHHLKAPLIMITASHNPAEHNGFYICNVNALSIYQDNGMKEIASMMQSGALYISNKKGTIKEKDIFPLYVKHILSSINKNKIKPLKIVVDAGNGVGAITAERVLKHLKQIHPIKLFFASDGSFPNRAPDTSIETNLIKLGRKVRQVKADLGIAFDGDADRVAFVNQEGIAIDGSFIGALIAQHLLQKAKKSKEKVVYTIGCSRIVPETIKHNGGTPIREKVGHSFVNHSMHRSKALFGIEHTGHFFYRDNFNTESAIITALLVCEIYSTQDNVKMSHLIAPFKKYYRTREISIPTQNQQAILNRIKPMLIKEYGNRIDPFDGFYIDTGKVWFRVRASQTEALIRFQVEGINADLVKKEVNKIKKIIFSAISS